MNTIHLGTSFYRSIEDLLKVNTHDLIDILILIVITNLFLYTNTQ